MIFTLVNIEWSLILFFSITIIATVTETDSLSKECEVLNITIACEKEVCRCRCWKNIYSKEVCSYSYENDIYIEYERPRRIQINCYAIKEQYKRLPLMRIGQINEVQLSNCKLPHSNSIKTVIERLCIENTRSLYINYKNNTNKNQYEFLKDNMKEFPHLTKLYMEGDIPITLPSNVFDEALNITYLKLRNVDIETNKVDLTQLVNLEILAIFETNIPRFDDGAFETLTNLKELLISFNKLETISKLNFKGLKTLKELGLLNNKIKSIQHDSFAYFENVEFINLGSNHLTSIPEGLFSSNRHLRNVTIATNKISGSLPPGLFANKADLTFVEMSFNKIVSLPKDLFANSTNLMNINFSRNKVLKLPKAIFYSLVRLERLELQSNALKRLENNLLKDCRKLKYINLSDNAIEFIPSGFFKFTADLNELRISNNRLTRIERQTFENQINLLFVDLSDNRLHFDFNSIEESTLDNSPFHKQLIMETLILKNNSLNYVLRDFTVEIGMLKKLDLSYNNISYVEYSNLHFKNGIKMDLSNNQITEINFLNSDKIPISLPETFGTLVHVFLNNNPLNCNCRAHYFVEFLQNPYSNNTSKYFIFNVDNLTCSQPERLRDQLAINVDVMDLTCDFKNEDEEKCPDKCKCSTRLADKALIVDCSNQSLESVPQLPVASKVEYFFTILNIEGNRLNELPSIQNSIGYSEMRQIFARGNNISSIIIDQLPENLTHLDISENNLQSLDDSIIGKMNSTTSLSLSGNPWPCDCKMRNLFLFMQDNHKKISDYSSIMCSNGNYLSKLTIGDICPEDIQFIIILSSVLALVGIIIGLLTAIYFKYQQEIKIWMYWNNILPCIFNSDVLDTDKKYDAFISYSHKDEDFVVDQLIPELEQRQKFNLCIHKRDWMAGDFIPDQIIRSVSDSRRTIVVLSPHYVESVWGTMEFRAAHRSAMDEQVSRVIVIIYGQVDKSTLDPELKSYIDMNTYIEWGDPWFWERLHYALRNIKTKNNKYAAFNSQLNLSISTEDKSKLFQLTTETTPQGCPAECRTKANETLFDSYTYL